MVHSTANDRRQHRRYLTEGKAVIAVGPKQLNAQIVDVGKGGALVLAPNHALTVGEQVEVRVAIAGYPASVSVSGRVARTDTHAIGISFSEIPVELEEAVLWLEAEFLATMF